MKSKSPRVHSLDKDTRKTIDEALCFGVETRGFHSWSVSIVRRVKRVPVAGRRTEMDVLGPGRVG